MSIKIRPLEMNDFPAWLPLWIDNNMGNHDEDITTETWTRIIDPNHPVNGLGAFKGDKLVGILHYILHNTTGYIQPVCYMQDLFVNETARKGGIGRKLVKELERIARREKWSRMYWLAEEDNEAAQALYKDFGVKIPFTVHILSTGN